LPDTKNIGAENWEKILWAQDTMLDGLSKLRERAESQALDAIGWYYEKKKSKNFWSRWLRFWAIAFTILGGLVPLLSAAGLVQIVLRYYSVNDPISIQLAELHFNQLGYVLIGFAAGCVAFDRFFGFSTNWMRYIGAAMRIETARVKFAFEWEHLVAPLKGRDPNDNEVRELLEAIEKFSLAIREAIEQETGAWITEFQTNLSQLDKETKALFEGAQNEKKGIEQKAQMRNASRSTAAG
jgi:SMODS and SLOG-associating 2TM effector domain 2